MTLRLKNQSLNKLLLTGLISLSPTACLHDDDKTTDLDTTAPIVSSTSPADAATTISTGTVITATFNEDIFATTIDSNSFTVIDSASISGGWSSAVLVESGTTGAYIPDIGMDHSGHAIAVWRQNSSTYANRYIAGTGWGSEVLIETGSGATGSAKVAVSGIGEAVAIWRQSDGSKYNLNANHFK